MHRLNDAEKITKSSPIPIQHAKETSSSLQIIKMIISIKEIMRKVEKSVILFVEFKREIVENTLRLRRWKWCDVKRLGRDKM